MSNLTLDMRKGKPLGLIIKFAIPVIIGNLFQQAYAIIDSIIVGRGLGSLALASVGAVDWLQWMFMASAVGLTQGFGIAFSRSFGKNNYEELRHNIGLSVILSVFIGLFLVAFSEIMAVPFLGLLKTPLEIRDLSLEYVRYLFAGLIVVVIYNMLASILRSVGNSRSPLVAMIIASIINIVLDIYFIYGLKMGVKGAAIATVIAQIFSASYCLWVLRKINIVRLHKDDFKFDFYKAVYLLKLGVPMAIMNIVIGVGGIIVQRVTNGFGIVFVTGVTITNKLYTLFELASTSFGLSMATFTAQNHGAKLNDRILDGIKTAMILVFVTGFVVASLMIGFGKNIIGFFIDANSNNITGIINVAYEYLLTMCLGVWLLYTLHIFRSTLQGLGNTIFPLFSSLIEFCLRVGTVTLMPSIIGQKAVYFSEIAAWIGAVILLSVGLLNSLKKLKLE